MNHGVIRSQVLERSEDHQPVTPQVRLITPWLKRHVEQDLGRERGPDPEVAGLKHGQDRRRVGGQQKTQVQ